ncbi:MAG: MarR family transcriptional regulator [Thiogranum sp.]|jgi:DNA-binding MarR family transcriptional regulator
MTNQDPTRNLGFLVHEVARLMRRSFDRRVQSLGLTQAQWRALVHLSRCEGMNQAALAEILEIQPITLTRLLDKLQQSGWVERRQDPADRRSFRLYLTAQAQPLLAELEAAGTEIRAEATSGMNHATRRELIDLLCAVKSNLLAAERSREAGQDVHD